MNMHDLVIRNGFVIDGTGKPGFEADVAIDDGRIRIVGNVVARGREEIDARGQIVTPGFVDIHTHYDGQATWDSYLAPSSQHGVTTTVMGNCGVGFAPCAPDKHDWLINLMEGVEDIPGSALAEGLPWNWESFPQYLDALERRHWTMDVGTQIPHGAIRTYVMGDRGATDAPATHEDRARIAELVEQGMRAGALGFSTSRVMFHRAKSGELVPGTNAREDELLAIGHAMAKVSRRAVFEAAADIATPGELDWVRHLCSQTGVSVSVGLLQSNDKPEEWRESLQRIDAARASGLNVRGQITVRFVGLMFNWCGSLHPFMCKPTWKRICSLPWEELLRQLRDPGIRAQMISEPSEYPTGPTAGTEQLVSTAFDLMYAVGKEIDYEPRREDTLGAVARQTNVDPATLAYDALMADEGQGFIVMTLFNYAYGNYDHLHEMLSSPSTLVSLSDGGAHVGMICDASAPSFLLAYWARDRARGAKIALEEVVRRQTSDTASFYGLDDRGVLAPGYLGDVNVIDLDHLKLEKPYLINDLPAGGKRLLQKARGYTATIKRGVVVSRDGEFTGAFPGRLLRGAAAAPT
jgi:N-acyl-D-amino-acid deacylase